MNYFKDIVYASIICGIITSISGFTKNGTGKYVKYVCALFFLCVIMTPFIKDITESIEYFDDLYSLTNEEYVMNKNYSQNRLDLMEVEICKAASDNAGEAFNVNQNNFKVELSLTEDNDGNIEIKDARVCVSEDALKISENIVKHHFERILGCSVEIVYDS